MNLRELKEIFRLIERTDFTSVEVEQGDWKVRVERGKGAAVAAPIQYVAAPAAAPQPGAPASGRAEAPSETPAKAKEEEGGIFVTSPFVGTFYRSPSPDADPYVREGQVVKKGQVLCIIEAMKLMNEIESDYDGKVASIFVENGQPVEFGEKLFQIEPA